MGAVGCENPLVSLLYKFYFLLIKLREREEILYKSTYVHMCVCAFCIFVDIMSYMFVYASVCRNRMIWYTYSFPSFLARNLCLLSFIWNPNIIFYFKPFEDNMTSRRG